MGQLYPNSVSSTVGFTLNTRGGISGGGSVALGGELTIQLDGAGRKAYSVTPAPDGNTQDFTITGLFPTVSVSYADVFLDGKLQVYGTDVTITNNILSFVAAPPTVGSQITVVMAQTNGSRSQYILTPEPDGATQAFTFPSDVPLTTYVDIYVDGEFQAPGDDYTLDLVSGNWTITFGNAPADGSVAIAVFDSESVAPRNWYQLSPEPGSGEMDFRVVGGTPDTTYIDVYRNRLYQTPAVDHYLNFVNGTWSVSFVNPPAGGDSLGVVF